MRLTARIAIVVPMLLLAAAAVAPVLAANADVQIIKKQFSPSEITIGVGDTVTWTVITSAGEPHSVTSGTPADSGKIFDSGTAGANNSFKLRDDGQTYQHTFNEPGEFLYYCVIHPVDMTGKVVVLAEGASPPPSIEPAPSEQETGISPERRLLAGGILAVSLVLMFLLAWVWRRMNPA
jgi:plastocyanin